MEKINKIKIKIDGKTFFTEKGKNLLEILNENKINIPNLCFHQDVKTSKHCNLCLIKILGEKNLKKACKIKIEKEISIITNSEEIFKKRKGNLEKIVEKHLLECNDCVWFLHCKLLELIKEFDIKSLAKRDKKDEILQVGTIVFDQTKCFGCGNCVKVCPTGFLSVDSRGKISLSKDETKKCISCGQCILHCSVGAIEGVGEFESLENLFKDKDKITIVQFAPSIRTSIGEEFGMEIGEIATGKLVSALKKAGFDYVFDTATGADFTTMEESDELIERLTKNEKLPGMTSCCPAWVKFIEFNYPEFIENLCTSRSPQVMLGGIIKKYLAKKEGIDPKKIFVVSIMPCVAKKFEIKREELKINGEYPVDMVLTTRELVRLFKKNKIDFKNIKEEKIDSFLSPSGAGVIYGASGGVFESALRTAYFKMTKKELNDNLIKEIRGIDGIKEKEIKIGERNIKICVVSGIKNAVKILEKLKKNPKYCDALEVMACPGGCVGGGGQSLPSNKEIIKKRGESLYKIDKDKKIRRAHQNLFVKKVYDDFFTSEEKRKEILHTNFYKRKKDKVIKLKDSKETIM